MTRLRICTLLLSLFYSSLVYTQSEKISRLSAEGIDYAYNMQFYLALDRFDEIIGLDAANPHGHLLKAVSHYYLYLVDMDNKEAEKEFKDLAFKAIKISNKSLQKNSDDHDALFSLGTMNMYLAAYYGENDSWIRAYWYGKEGINYLETLIEKKPDYYDAYLGLGLYHYYAAVMPKLVKAISYLLGVEADRLKGLRELELAQEKGTYARVEAKFFLGYIYLYLEKDYKKSLEYFRTLCERYPENPIFHIVLGDSYRKLGKHDLAIEAYRHSVSNDNYKRFPRVVNSSFYMMGNIYFEKNEMEKALAMYSKAVENAARFPDKDDGVYSWGLYKQGECYEILGQREMALSYYRRVTKADNKFAFKKAQHRLKNPLLKIDADLTRARNFLITRNFRRAIHIYEDIIPQLAVVDAEYPLSKLPELYYHLGRAKYEMKAYAAAIKDFKKVLAVEKIEEKWIRPWTHYRLGRCYQLTGRVKDALGQYKLAYKYDIGELRFEIDKINREIKGSN